MKDHTKSAVAAGLLLAALGVIIYGSSAATPLFCDAEEIILDNPLLRSWDLGALFSAPFFPNRDWGTQLPLLLRWRPLTTLLFWLQYQLWNGAPLGYHLVNIAWHVLNGWLLWRVARLLSAGPLAALGIAAAFLIHPAHSPAVVYVASLGDLLAGSAVLVLVLLHLDWRLRGGTLSDARFSAEMVLFLLALLSKESAVIAPLIILACQLTLREGQDKNSFLKELAGLGLVLLAYLAVRSTAFPIGRMVTEPGGLWPAAFLQALSLYSHLLVFPTAYRFPFMLGSAGGGQSISLFGLTLFSAGLLWWRLLGGEPSEKGRVIRFGLLWTLFGTLPFLNFLHPMLLQSNYLYVPLMGFLLAVGIGIEELSRRLSARGLRQALAGALLLLGGWMAAETLRHNRVWGEPELFYAESLKPGSQYAKFGYTGLVSFYRHEKAYEKGLTVAQRAIARAPEDADYRNIAGTMYQDLGRTPEAKEMYEAALKLEPSHAKAQRNLAVLTPNNSLDALVQVCREGPQAGPLFIDNHLKLARKFWNSGRTDSAIDLLQGLMKIEPTSPEPWKLYGDYMSILDYVAEADRAYEAYLKLVPDSEEVRERLRNRKGKSADI